MGWYIVELSTVFISIGIVAGLIGCNSSKFSAFVAGAKDVTFGALL